MSSYGGFVEVVHELLKNKSINVNHEQKVGGTALFVSSHQGHAPVLIQFASNQILSNLALVFHNFLSFLFLGCSKVVESSGH